MADANRVQIIGHVTNEAATFQGRARELAVDTSVGTLHVHDGSIPGGTPLAREDLVNSPAATSSIDGKMTAADFNQIAANVSDIAALQAALTALTASQVAFDPGSSTLTATDVQAAIDELDVKVEGLSDLAVDIVYDNTASGLTADNVQDAIDEIVAGLGTASTLSKAQIADYAFAAGVFCVFTSASAPQYWTLNAAQNDRVLRISNTAGGGLGGSWTISGLTVDGHVLTIAEMPAHVHSGIPAASSSPQFQSGSNPIPNFSGQQSTDSTGGDGSHTHGLTADGIWRPAYEDVIVCSKDVPTQ